MRRLDSSAEIDVALPARVEARPRDPVAAIGQSFADAALRVPASAHAGAGPTRCTQGQRCGGRSDAPRRFAPDTGIGDAERVAFLFHRYAQLTSVT